MPHPERGEEAGEAQDPVDPGLDHHPGEQRRHVARGGRVGLRQPDVQRDQAGLGAEADEPQREEQPRRGRTRAPQGLEADEVESPRGPAQQEEEGEQEGGAHVGGHEEDEAGAADLGLLVVEGDEREGGDGHHLPGHEEEHAVGRGEHERDGDEQGPVEEDEGAERSPPHRRPHVARAEGRRRDGEGEERGLEERRERVEPEVEGPERLRPGEDPLRRGGPEQEREHRGEPHEAPHHRQRRADRQGERRAPGEQRTGERPGGEDRERRQVEGHAPTRSMAARISASGARAARLAADPGIAQRRRQRGQRVQVGAGGGADEEAEGVDRHAVAEVDGGVGEEDRHRRLVDAQHDGLAGVGDGDAVAERGRAQVLPGEDHLVEELPVEAPRGGEPVDHGAEEGLLPDSGERPGGFRRSARPGRGAAGPAGRARAPRGSPRRPASCAGPPTRAARCG